MSGVAVVIPTYNRRDLLGACLNAAFGQTRCPARVIVVDNGSTDGTRAMLADQFPMAECVSVHDPIGSAGGFHEGIQHAYDHGYEWIWLMDNDAEPAPDALALLLDAAEQVQGGRVFCSLVVQPGGKTINWGYHLYEGERYTDGSRCVFEVGDLEALGRPVVNGLGQFYAGPLIHREVIQAVGTPTPGFFTRGDEVDYVLRIQEAGFKTYTVVGSRVTHPPEPHYTARVLGRTVRVPVLAPWKQYYAMRNEIVNSRRHGWGRAGWRGHALRLLVSYAFRSLILPDHKLRRLWHTCLGFTDGILGRIYVR